MIYLLYTQICTSLCFLKNFYEPVLSKFVLDPVMFNIKYQVEYISTKNKTCDLRSYIYLKQNLKISFNNKHIENLCFKSKSRLTISSSNEIRSEQTLN